MKNPLDYLKPEVWRTPQGCLVILAAAMPLSFATWMSLLNNFAIERAQFGGEEIGILQSLREIPGFLAFTAVFILLAMKERTLAFLSLIILGVGTAVTGMYATVMGLYVTTVIMSIGFHYYETMQMSLTLQWVSKEDTPKAMGRQISARSIASLVAYALIWIVLEFLELDYAWIYAIGGGLTIAIMLFVWVAFPAYEGPEEQHKKLVLRKRYWLYYALTFMSGARRQIFVVFAGFLMVQKFGYDAATITFLYLINHVFSIWLAPKIGGYIAKWGERNTLIFEYVGLIIVFMGYALTENAWVAASLYVVDHMFFAFAIAQKSYFQKIADPKDIASTSGVSFSINHIAAVFIPALFGIYLWDVWPGLVFIAGAGMAAVSLVLSINVPRNPAPGNEVMVGKISPVANPAE